MRDRRVTPIEAACRSGSFLVAVLYLYGYNMSMNATTTQQLRNRREQILEAMRALDPLRRGSLSRQFFGSRHPRGAAGPGPYFVLQGYLQGQKFSQRVPADQAAAVANDVANYKRFQELADEFVTVTEQLTLQTETAAKKNFRSRSTKSGSGKPPRSSG